jgi:hypothetical protein
MTRSTDPLLQGLCFVADYNASESPSAYGHQGGYNQSPHFQSPTSFTASPVPNPFVPNPFVPPGSSIIPIRSVPNFSPTNSLQDTSIPHASRGACGTLVKLPWGTGPPILTVAVVSDLNYRGTEMVCCAIDV